MEFHAATIESVIHQAVGLAAHQPDYDELIAIADEAAREVRQIVTGQLTKLLDLEAVALEWNDAIDAAIQMVEDLS